MNLYEYPNPLRLQDSTPRFGVVLPEIQPGQGEIITSATEAQLHNLPDGAKILAGRKFREEVELIPIIRDVLSVHRNDPLLVSTLDSVKYGVTPMRTLRAVAISGQDGICPKELYKSVHGEDVKPTDPDIQSALLVRRANIIVASFCVLADIEAPRKIIIPNDAKKYIIAA